MKEGKGKIKRIKTTTYILIPYQVAMDSAFPFKPNQTVKIKITNKKLIIESEENE